MGDAYSSEVSRRKALLHLGNALVMVGVRSMPVSATTVTLDEDTVAIVESLIAKGYHRAPEEVIEAALDAVRRCDG